MNYAPVIIPTLNRYNHLKNCIESLLYNELSSETELYVGLDYPPSEKYIEGYNKVRAYLKELKGFKSIYIIERNQNMGAIENIKDLIKTVLENHDFFIFSEDDNVFSPCFLEYINKGLEKYKNDKSILSISGYSYPIQMPNSECTIIKMQRYYSDWGFGMWKDRYEILKNTITQAYFDTLFKTPKNTNLLRKKSKKNYIYAFGLVSPSKANIRPMDYTSSIYQILNNKYSIMPKLSLVKNNGWDNSGLHCQDSDKNAFKIKYLFVNQEISTAKKFENFLYSEKESEIVNKLCDASLIGDYDRKVYKKVRIKEIFFRYGFLSKIRKLLGKK